MNKTKITEYTIAFTRIYLALILIISGLDKINDLNSFAQSIENYKIIPVYAINIIAIIIPWLEVVGGGLLFFGLYIRENSTLILSLLIIFTMAIISAIARDLDIECGCQGTFDGQKVGFLKIVENIALMIVAILSIRFPKQVLMFLNK